MGEFKRSIEQFLLSRPRMYQYESLNLERKEFIEDIVKHYVIANPVLRVNRVIGKFKAVNPKHSTLWTFPWEDIVAIKNRMGNGELFDVLRIVYGITTKQFNTLEITNTFAAYKWVTDQLIAIHEAEQDRINVEMTNEDKEAGAEELAEYGYYNSLKAVEPDLLKHNAIMKLPYSIIFRDLAYNTKINSINKIKAENARRKTQGNS